MFSFHRSDEEPEKSDEEIDDDMKSPKVLDKLKDIDANEGDSVRFDIQATGDPFPTAKWYVNGKMIMESPRIKLVSDKEKEIFSLIISSVEQKDDGEIKCVLSNKAGSVTETCELLVEGGCKKF